LSTSGTDFVFGAFMDALTFTVEKTAAAWPPASAAAVFLCAMCRSILTVAANTREKGGITL
jgi:hypothetical protein